MNILSCLHLSESPSLLQDLLPSTLTACACGLSAEEHPTEKNFQIIP